MVLTAEVIQTAITRGGFFQGLGSLDSLFPGMYEHHHLMTESNQLRNLLEGHLIEIPARLSGVWFPFHADEMLFQWDRAERRVEKEKTSIARDTAKILATGSYTTEQNSPEEISDVDVVRQGGTESDYSNDRLARLDLP
jgi:hypothetical protein